MHNNDVTLTIRYKKEVFHNKFYLQKNSRKNP